MSPIQSKAASDAYRRGFDSVFKKAKKMMIIVRAADGEETTLSIDATQYGEALVLGGRRFKRVPATNIYTETGELEDTPLSPEALEARKPQPPEELVGALQDRVHVDVGRARPGRAVKAKK